MGFETIKVRIKGVVPLLMHNGQTADPLNPYAKRIKDLSAKRKKTDADYQALSDVEWEAGLYLDDQERIVIPGELIESMLVAAAKTKKMGPQAKAGILSDGLWPLIYSGPKDWKKLAKDPRFIDRRPARVQQSRVCRTRPIFHEWELVFDVSFNPDLLNKAQVIEFLKVAGQIKGLCDYIPKYGRFEVLEIVTVG